MTRSRRRSAAILTALTTVATTLGLLLAGAPPATAAISTGHGIGYLAENGFSWIGSYRLDDGSLVFCLEVGKKAPTGHDYQFVDASALGRFSPDDLARLAYLSRTAAPSTDPTEAAAGQLATWRISGLDGHSPEYYAQRAGASGQAVLDRSTQLLATADAPSGASRSVTGSVALTAADSDGRMTVTSGLTVDFLATGPTVLTPGSHSGTMSLSGAVFDDGKAERTISNGETVSITTTGTEPTASIVAAVRYTDLPYGSGFIAGNAGEDVQQVLVARPGAASGSATVTSTVPSTKKFQPIVNTKTSAATAAAGEAISDELVVSALVDESREDLLPGWGVYRPATPPASGAVPAVDENGMLPIPVVVESSLLGPFSDPIEPAAEPPAGAPVVCTVEVRIETGPGTYRTPDCVLPSSGYFVWVERISPSRTPVDQGGTRMLPWQSAFGTASEVTFVAPPPTPEIPAVPAAPAAAPVLAETGTTGTGVLLLVSGAALALGTLIGVGVLWRRRLSVGVMQPTTD